MRRASSRDTTSPTTAPSPLVGVELDGEGGDAADADAVHPGRLVAVDRAVEGAGAGGAVAAAQDEVDAGAERGPTDHERRRCTAGRPNGLDRPVGTELVSGVALPSVRDDAVVGDLVGVARGRPTTGAGGGRSDRGMPGRRSLGHVEVRPRACAARAGRWCGGGPRRARRPAAGSGSTEYIAASGVSWLTPAAPKPWMASSMTSSGHEGHGDLDAGDLGAGAPCCPGCPSATPVERVAAGPGRWRCGRRRCAPPTRPARPGVLPKAVGGRAGAGTAAPAPARRRRWCACSGGCGRARGGPGRWRSRRPPRRAMFATGTRTSS